jgi:hypothetical protein
MKLSLRHQFLSRLDISVGIALCHGLDDQSFRVRFPVGAGNFSLYHGVQPPIQWVPGALSLGVKRPGLEADHSPPSSAEVSELVEIYLHSRDKLSWCGAQLKHRDFTLPLPC